MMYLKTKHYNGAERTIPVRETVFQPDSGVLDFENPDGSTGWVSLISKSEMEEYRHNEAYGAYIVSETGKTIDAKRA